MKEGLRDYLDAEEALKTAIEALKDERLKGHWLDKDGEPTDDQYAVHCSKCTKWSEYASNFCMNCGADMRGEEE